MAIGVLAGADERQIASVAGGHARRRSIVGRIHRLGKEEHLGDPRGAIGVELGAAGDEQPPRRARELEQLRRGRGGVVEVPDAAHPPGAQLADLLRLEMVGVAGEDDSVRPESLGESRHQRVREDAQPPAPAGDVHQPAGMPRERAARTIAISVRRTPPRRERRLACDYYS